MFKINFDIGVYLIIKFLDYERIKCYRRSWIIYYKVRKWLKVDEISIFF